MDGIKVKNYFYDNTEGKAMSGNQVNDIDGKEEC